MAIESDLIGWFRKLMRKDNKSIETGRIPEGELDFLLPRQPRWKASLSNLRSILSNPSRGFISAKPVQTDLLLPTSPWFRTLLGNFRAAFSGQIHPAISAPPANNYSCHLLLPSGSRWREIQSNLKALFFRGLAGSVTATPAETDLLLGSALWFQTLFSNLGFALVRQVQPAISAQPIDVGELFKGYRFRKASIFASLAIHFFLVAGGLWLSSRLMEDRSQKRLAESFTRLEVTPLVWSAPPKLNKSGGGGGGGRREETRASQGKLPKYLKLQLTPPTPKILNPDPILSVEPSVVVPESIQIAKLNFANLGDPLNIPGPPSSGPGIGGGIGTGSGGGVGSGKGSGVGPGENGGFGGGPFRIGGGVSPPFVLYQVEPTYTEEARKAHYQGIVLLSAVVRKDGSIEILKVLRGLGLGLDDNAISALKKWRFRPGTRAGEPVDVALNIEVNFALR